MTNILTSSLMTAIAVIYLAKDLLLLDNVGVAAAAQIRNKDNNNNAVVIGTIRKEIDGKRVLLRNLSRALHAHPETNFEEVYAHDFLTHFLEQQGFAVKRHFAGVETAFRAEIASPYFRPPFNSSAAGGATVVLCCEYDALPQLGHACGHNLIAEASIGAFLGLAAAVKSGLVRGRVVLLGTPAEEGGGGKIKLLEAGAFNDVDFAMMAHGGPINIVYTNVLGYGRKTATFKGRAAHAAAGPWDGINALDAAVAAYTSLAMLRQQIKPYNRLHAVIVEGGLKASVIPERAVMNVGFRSPTRVELLHLIERGTRILQLAAEMHNCTVEFAPGDVPYSPMLHNHVMGDTYAKYERRAGTKFVEDERVKSLASYSTDMGDVSLHVPSIHPIFLPHNSAAGVTVHTDAFRVVAGSDAAQAGTIRAAKSLAFAAAELLNNATLLHAAKAEFALGIKQHFDP